MCVAFILFYREGPWAHQVEVILVRQAQLVRVPEGWVECRLPATSLRMSLGRPGGRNRL